MLDPVDRDTCISGARAVPEPVTLQLDAHNEDDVRLRMKPSCPQYTFYEAVTRFYGMVFLKSHPSSFSSSLRVSRVY